MRADEVRRLTGRHPLGVWPGAAMEVHPTPGEDFDAALTTLVGRIESAATALGWDATVKVRRHAAGASVAVGSPPDGMLTATDVLEWAADGSPIGSRSHARIARTALEERNDALRACLAALGDLPHVWDDEGLTVGTGVHARTWPLHDLPSPTALGPARAVPTVLVTGTNGKTTSTRMVARMARAAGCVDGLTSSDGIEVGGELVEEGDWTGPVASRHLLRDTRVTFAVLETARGGLLRRGLAYEGADAALVTNVAIDHLGDWGLDTVADMASTKLLVADALRPGGTLVYGADSGPLAEAVPAVRARRPDLRVLAFADRRDPAGLDAWAADGALWLRTEAGPVRLVDEVDVPLAFGGAARHNVENALGAALLAYATGLPLDAIAAALRAMRPTVAESRGRMNVFRTGTGATLLLDFAHNPDGVRVVGQAVAAWPRTRLTVVIGQAGDRSDQDLYDLAEVIAALGPAHVYLKELPNHLRGRKLGVIPQIMQRDLATLGVPPEMTTIDDDEDAAVRRALANVQPGELCLLLVHDGWAPAIAAIEEIGGVPD